MAAGGHCYGFSTLSLLFYAGHARSSGFGAPVTPRLQLEDNQPLQQEIAYAWTFPALPGRAPRRDLRHARRNSRSLIEGLNAPTRRQLCFFSPPRRLLYAGLYQGDGSGGHAVTPYAIKDRGGGMFAVLVYDSNLPGRERTLPIDREANTWSYNAAASPTAPAAAIPATPSRSLFLFPTGPALGPQPCPFSAPKRASGATGEAIRRTPGARAAGTLL